MGHTTHRFRVAEARRVRHPVLTPIEKHYFLVRAKEVPTGLRADANAREPVGLNRQVYRDVRDSLLCLNSVEGTFDLMNKGIVVLAEEVRRINDTEYDVVIREGQGIVDGAHTYTIITANQDDAQLSDNQYVEVQVRTGVSETLVTDIARGLNTGIAVKQHSLANLDKAFQWLKEEIANESYYKLISWKEGDDGEYDVRDLICVLEALNIFDYPNNSGAHPVSAYEKWSAPTSNFIKDYMNSCEMEDETKTFDSRKSKYHKLRHLLREALILFDTIRHDFRELHNESGGAAGKMRIVEVCRKDKLFSFPFAKLKASPYRLTKGALYPMFAAFRNAVEIDARSGDARWVGGFESVMALWKEVGRELVGETFNATEEIGNLPDQIGKSRSHWANLHKTLQIHVLLRHIARSDSKRVSGTQGSKKN